MKVITVVGARPQFIKAAVVSHEFRKFDRICEKIIHTGQHFDHNMSEIFFDELGIGMPSFDLNIHGGNHGQMTGRMLESIETILIQEKPDWVLVYGDTNSTLAGALAAAKLHIPIAHVEAGLRSFNKKMPEEINRILTDQVSTKLFVPTENGRNNLLKEGFSSDDIFLVGDVMYDAAKYFGSQSQTKSKILEKMELNSADFILATCHRAENTNNESRLRNIYDALCKISETVRVVFPLHPRTRDLLAQMSWYKGMPENIDIIPPIGYIDMVALEKNSSVILTDSGGIQKEAFFYKVPCVTMRKETEWSELISAGWNSLANPDDSSSIFQTVMESIGRHGKDVSLYGDGNSANKIVKELIGT